MDSKNQEKSIINNNENKPSTPNDNSIEIITTTDKNNFISYKKK